MNVKLLRKVKRHILAEPKRLLMCYWRMAKRENDPLPQRHAGYAKCGTAACIAGWSWILTYPRRFFTTSSEAAELLGIDSGQARFKLFSAEQWPEPFKSKFKDDGTLESAKVAAARIEHFIKTKGKE